MKYRNIAYILGLDPNGLGVVRSLGRHGIRIRGFDYQRKGPGFYSKYAESYVCPSPVSDPKKLADLLIQIHHSEDEKGILYPVSDEFVLFISRNRSVLSPYFLFALPDEDIVEALLNKSWQYRKAEDSGILYPQTLYPKTMEDVYQLMNIVEYPALIKPCYTFLWKGKGFLVKGFEVRNSEELVEKFSLAFSAGVEVIIQSIIPGPVTNFYEVCIYCQKNRYSPVTFIKHKIRQFPLDFGLGSFMESIRSEHLSDIANVLFEKIRYHGIGEVELKMDPRDNLFKMIEINPRITLQNSLAAYCGINFPMMQYCDLAGYPFSSSSDVQAGMKWIWFEIDFEAFRSLNKCGRLSLMEWLRSIFAARSYAVFDRDDIYPFLRSLMYGKAIIKFLLKLFKHILVKKA